MNFIFFKFSELELATISTQYDSCLENKKDSLGNVHIYSTKKTLFFLNQKFVLVALGCGGSTSYNISYLVQGATTNLPGQYF
jgi:hypothetical protein